MNILLLFFAIIQPRSPLSLFFNSILGNKFRETIACVRYLARPYRACSCRLGSELFAVACLSAPRTARLHMCECVSVRLSVC